MQPSARASRSATGATPTRSRPCSTRCRWRRIRVTFMRGVALPLAFFLPVAVAPVRAADEVAVSLANGSEPRLCAESDNVYLKLTSGEVRRFVVEAEHPAYMGTIVVDRWAP